MMLLICGIQKIQQVDKKKKKQIDRYREQTSGYQWEGEGPYKGSKRDRQTIGCKIGYKSVFYNTRIHRS